MRFRITLHGPDASDNLQEIMKVLPSRINDLANSSAFVSAVADSEAKCVLFAPLEPGSTPCILESLRGRAPHRVAITAICGCLAYCDLPEDYVHVVLSNPVLRKFCKPRHPPYCVRFSDDVIHSQSTSCAVALSRPGASQIVSVLCAAAA